MNKKEIIERDNQIIFEDLSWPKNVKTNYRITDKKNSVKQYYTLECLLYFLKNIDLFHPDYCKQAAVDNILAVRRPDRKALLAYLNGETATCASIDKSAPSEKPTQVKHTQNYDGGESAAKKPRIEETILQKPPKEEKFELAKETLVTVSNNNRPEKLRGEKNNTSVLYTVQQSTINQQLEYKSDMTFKLENCPDTEQATELYTRGEKKHECDQDEMFLLSLNNDFKDISQYLKDQAKAEIIKIIDKYKNMLN